MAHDMQRHPWQKFELRGHEDSVMYLRWHPTNEDRLASLSSTERCVKFWDARMGKSTATITTPGHNLYIAWTKDGNQMAVGSREDIVCCLDVRKMKISSKQTFRYQVNELGFLQAIGKPSRLLLQCTGKNNGDVDALLWPEGKHVATLHGHTVPALSLAVDPKEELIATGGADALVSLWDAKDFICLKTYFHMDFPIRALSFSQDSRYLAMTGEDPYVFVEDVISGESLGKIALRYSPEDCAWNPAQNILAYPVDYGNESHVELRIQKSQK